MSTSILYHGNGVRGYKYLKTEYRNGAMIFYIEKAAEQRCCALCGWHTVTKTGRGSGEVKTWPIVRREGRLALHLLRL